MTELPSINSDDVSIKEVEFSEEHSPDDSDLEGVSIRLEIYSQSDSPVEFRFRFVPFEDGAGTRYKPYSEQHTAGVEPPATIKNRAKYEAARAIAELTGTRATATFQSQEYLDSL
ncbi:hypothetical protein [Halobellus rufus]|uniref:hypothetical protein n=1 Tax=Halobellus rufus TaxID=1448860 RepID=UPI000679410D|nr:hypothetical protein [Halobellus rufus]